MSLSRVSFDGQSSVRRSLNIEVGNPYIQRALSNAYWGTDVLIHPTTSLPAEATSPGD